MHVGVPKEIKNLEMRVGLDLASVNELVTRGHSVTVETGAGVGAGVSDSDYSAVGASIVDSASTVFAQCDMIVKVKEPQAVERKKLRAGQIIFTYLHLAPDPDQTADLIDSGATCIAYETVTSDDGILPLLSPMSKVAGRMSVQAAAHSLESAQGGAGLLLGGVPGVAPAKVVVIGGGVVGENAAEMAIGLGADVTVLDRNHAVLDRLAARFGPAIKTVYSTTASLRSLVLDADAVVGAVLVRGARAPRLVTAEMVSLMRPGSVLVDVAIDQGGAFETSRPTTHSDPTYLVDDVVHYCVANMPGAVPKTATSALNNSTLPFVLALADKGLARAMSEDHHLRNGLNVIGGKVTEPAVAKAMDLTYHAPEQLAELEL